MALTLTVRPCTADAGALPQTMRPSLFFNGTTDNDAGQFILLSNIGMLKDDLVADMGDHVQETLANFRALFDTNSLHIGRPMLQGTPMMLKNEVFITPYMHGGTWLGGLAISGGNFNKANGIPNDLEAYEDLWYQIAGVPLEYGVDPDKVWWGFRNEFAIGAAHSAGGFDGSLDDFVLHYAAYVRGIKRRSTQYRVGGPDLQYDVAKLQNLRETDTWDTVPLVAFLRKCANPPRWLYDGARVPIDFISIHSYIDLPWIHVMRPLANDISFAGYDPSKVSIFLTEWNFGLSFTSGSLSFFVKRSAGDIGAAHLAASSQNFEEHGITNATFALNRQGLIQIGTGYTGDGPGLHHIVQGGTYHNLPVGTAVRMSQVFLSMLGKRKIEYTLSQDAKDSGVVVTATADGSNRYLLISRYCERNTGYPFGGDLLDVWSRPATAAVGSYGTRAFSMPHVARFDWEMSRRGYRMRHGEIASSGHWDGWMHRPYSGMTHQNVHGYINGTYTPDAALPAQVLTDLAACKAHVVAYKAAMDGDVVLTVTVEDPSTVTAVTVYEIQDTPTNNPHRAYLTEYAASSNHDAAVLAAMNQATNTPTSSFTGGGGALPYSLTLKPFHTVLIRLTGNGAPNSAAGWQPVQVYRTSHKFLGLGPPSLEESGDDLNWDIFEDNNWKVSLSGAKRLRLPANMIPLQTVVLEITQSGGGSLTYEDGILFPRDVKPVISGAIGSITYLTGAVSEDGTKLRLAPRGPFTS